jgi:thiol-disulfide isomerase/thioredoxin
MGTAAALLGGDARGLQITALAGRLTATSPCLYTREPTDRTERRTSATPDISPKGQLPSLAGATGWLNSEPLTPAGLRGSVVLVEFWTFTCINWIRTLPYVRSWFEKYGNDGLVVLGVHTPEFEAEHDIERVRKAAAAMRVEFPIAIDNDYAIWSAFNNNYWPALYFAGADGEIRHRRFGEGDYEASEIVIQRLLAAAGVVGVSRELVTVDAGGVEAAADWEDLWSPETYIGYERATNFASSGGATPDLAHEYALPRVLELNQWALGGNWTIGRQAAVLNGPGGRIAHRFRARDLHLVMAPAPGDQPVRFRVLLDGEPPAAAHGVDSDEQGEGTVSAVRIYQLIRQRGTVAERTFEITFLDAGVGAYVFTFG